MKVIFLFENAGRIKNYFLFVFFCAEFGRKPDLTEASETHPLVYGRFVRYVALRELVRTSSLLAGQTPVSWT